MPNINFNITDGLPPFEVELIGSSIPKITYDDIGTYTITDVNNGIYTLKIVDSNGCNFEREIIVDPYITTTTTTEIPDKSIVIGQAQDILLIFDPDGTNKNSEYSGYPDSDIVTLYLWFKTYDGEPLNDKEFLSYSIEVDDSDGDSEFEFDSVSDEVHTEILEDISGPNDNISGNIILNKGFIEAAFKYIFYKGNANNNFEITIKSPTDNIYPNLKTKDETGHVYGISEINNEKIRLNY